MLAIEVASNAAAELWRRRAAEVSERALGALMLLDVGLLTALLSLTGGPLNPFSSLYLVNIALAAVVLSPRWTWGLAALSALCFGGLFAFHVPLPDVHAAHGGGEAPAWHLQGMWVAFALAAGFIVYFIQRVTLALGAREAELAAARARAAREERLASLASLAAGAAHELGTPLSTIAVVAKELERQLSALGPERSAAAGDARLIREQVERCRSILVQMTADAGESAGEAPAPIALEALLELALAELPTRDRVRCRLELGGRPARVRVPPRAVAQAIRGVVKNALEASPPAAEVALRVEADAAEWRIVVRDAGPGMDRAVLARAGEPFFTTKGGGASSGRGMGLGLFLTRVVLERLGGALEIASQPGAGTAATLRLPRAALEVS